MSRSVSPEESGASGETGARAPLSRLREGRERFWHRAMIGAVIATPVLITVLTGLMVRRWAYEETKPIRFVGDIRRGYRYGRTAAEVGLLNVYENVASQHPEGDYELDYGPLRLTVMRCWAALRPPGDPDVDSGWQPDYEFTAPVLRFNNFMELSAAVAVFFLVRWWVRRAASGRAPPEWWRGIPTAAIGALLVWFNPVLILSAHGWPTWDAWVVPFYIFAVLLACVDRWFAAGVVIAAGAMFKGQQLFAASIFVLWPVFSLRFGAALRWLAGFVFGAAIVVSPWLLTLKVDESEDSARRLNGAGLAFVLVVAAVGALGAVLVNRYRPAWVSVKDALRAAAGATGVALMLCMPWFGASSAWLDVGFGYGARHHADRMVASLSAGLPAIMGYKFGWQPTDTIWVGTEVPIRSFLVAVYALALVACAIGAAVQYRRRSVRFLAAIATPWLAFYTIMPQMSGRYLLYAATTASVLAVLRFPGVLVALFLTAVAFLATLHPMVRSGAQRGQFPGGESYWQDNGAWFFEICEKTLPDVGWGVMVVLVVMLYLAVVPGKRPAESG